MSSFNKVILMGNLTRDPELRVTPNGNNICKFSVATSRSYKTQDGEQREETTFVDIDVFGRRAEVIAKYFTKGKPILVEGRLKLDQWENQSGEKRSKLHVVLENFSFVGSRGESPESGYEETAPPPRKPPEPSSTPPPAANEDVDDDVPF